MQAGRPLLEPIPEEVWSGVDDGCDGRIAKPKHEGRGITKVCPNRVRVRPALHTFSFLLRSDHGGLYC
jgi:hypothetical protein